MVECPHKVLVLLPQSERRLRCRHCHLTISEKELGQGCCPECFEERGKRHTDFDVVDEAMPKVRYQCETCSLLIECEE